MRSIYIIAGASIAGAVLSGFTTAYAVSSVVTLHPGDVATVSCVNSTPTVTPPPAPAPAPTPSPTPPPASGSISRNNVYITGYADGDNTPKGVPTVDLDGHHGNAGGNCTYENPTTIAVGHVITNGVDKGDFAYGTKFYVPALQCYFAAQDTCGDGNTPQNQPCHSLKTADAGATLWLDAYVGPKGTASCEENMTKLYSVIQNPAAGLPVKQGNICN